MRAANVTWAGINVEDVKEMDFRPDETPAYELRNGDILLAEASGSPGEVGKPAIWRNEIPGACFQNTLVRVRAPAELVPFLFRHFLNDAMSGRFSKASRGVGIHHIGAQALSEWQTLIPPLGEQARIAEALDSYLTRLDAAIQGLKRVEANLKRYRASVLKAAAEGSLVPTEAELAKKEGRHYESGSILLARLLKERRRHWEEVELAKMKARGQTPKGDVWRSKYEEPETVDADDLPALPDGWCWATLPQLGELNRGKSKHRPRDDARLYDGPYPFVQTGDVRRADGVLSEFSQTYSEEGLRQSRLWPAGTLCITIAANIAETAILTFDACFPDSVVGFVSHGGAVLTRFVEYFIRTAKADLSRYAPATAQKNINLETLSALAVPLPPVSEQERIVQRLESLLSVSAQVSKAAQEGDTRIARLRQSILKWAFEGKLVDQDPNDEPAAILVARIKAQRAATDGGPSRRGQLLEGKKARGGARAG